MNEICSAGSQGIQRSSTVLDGWLSLLLCLQHIQDAKS